MDKDLESMAILRIQGASDMALKHYGTPLVVTYSGGKDSEVLIEIAKRANIPFEVLNNHTTADAPETVRYIRERFNQLESEGIKCTIEYPTYKGKPTSMWKLIREKKAPPTRLLRYCCEVLKEHGGTGRYLATGVRWAESIRRRDSRGIYERQSPKVSERLILNNDNDDKRLLFENCTLKAKRVVNPIIDWKDKDIWDYIKCEHIPTNPLYANGFNRIGCLGCPMAGGLRKYEFAKYPKYEALYIKAFDDIIKIRKENGQKVPDTWGENGKDLFHWWMQDGVLPGQIEMEFEDVD